MSQINADYEKMWWVKECKGRYDLFYNVADGLGFESMRSSNDNRKVLTYVCDKYDICENDRKELLKIYQKGFCLFLYYLCHPLENIKSANTGVNRLYQKLFGE